MMVGPAGLRVHDFKLPTVSFFERLGQANFEDVEAVHLAHHSFYGSEEALEPLLRRGSFARGPLLSEMHDLFSIEDVNFPSSCPAELDCLAIALQFLA